MKSITTVVLCFALLYLAGSCALSWQSALDCATTAAIRAADSHVAQEWALERDRQEADREWLMDNPDPSPEGDNL